ncbi:uncharacterized protein LOC131147998 [Malania oleifera]|uniref:uncharacterized protein LOC131147998 n=1 Tax=Malania oleifera TaxID=397392 RepID=UPI0025AE2D78|nr:uncharacterized protein LOC131147998 [Malania oleifera]
MAPKPAERVVGSVIRTRKTVRVSVITGSSSPTVKKTAIPVAGKVQEQQRQEPAEEDKNTSEEEEEEVKEEEEDQAKKQQQKTRRGGWQTNGDHRQENESEEDAVPHRRTAAAGGGGKKAKKRMKKRGTRSSGRDDSRVYKRYVYRVLKQVHPELGVSSKAMMVLSNYMSDMFDRLAGEAARLTKYAGRMTLSSREVQAAVRLVLPRELRKHAVAEGTKAVTIYMSFR